MLIDVRGVKIEVIETPSSRKAQNIAIQLKKRAWVKKKYLPSNLSTKNSFRITKRLAISYF